MQLIYLHVVLLVMLYDTSFESVNETIVCDLSSESYIDLLSLGGLFSHCRPRDILWGISPLSILKLFILIHVTI